HRATRVADDVEVRVERRGDGALLEAGVEDHHDFVVTHDVLTSSGLGGHGPSVAGGHASVRPPGEPGKDTWRQTGQGRGAPLSASWVGPGEERPHRRGWI